MAQELKSKELQVKIWDIQAACKERLGKLKDALSDANASIRADPKSPIVIRFRDLIFLMLLGLLENGQDFGGIKGSGERSGGL